MLDRFSRRLDQEVLDKLKAEPLFNDYLLPDIQKGDVFPAIRDNNEIHFYHKGSRLFAYTTNGFRTHVKFASVLIGKRDDYIEESDLASVRPISGFSDGYGAIKELCGKYAGNEAAGVASILSEGKLGQERPTGRWIIPLDIEACFSKSNDDEDDKVNRIDIVFLDGDSGMLRFCEAKHYRNGELWSNEDTKPPVANQLDRYLEEIHRRADEIVPAYVAHVQALNKLFGWAIPEPVDIDDKVPLFLLVFGFDKDQREGRLKPKLLRDGSLEGHYSYAIGDPGAIILANMWTNVKRH